MDSVNKATQTQLNNIQTRTGKSLDELGAVVRESGLAKHSEIRKMLIERLGLGYGDANALTHYVLNVSGEQGASGSAASSGSTTSSSSAATIGSVATIGGKVVDEIYSGTKAGLRPIHERLMETINGFGKFEISPKKGYISLRRKKQFAMIGPGSNTRVDVGLNVKGLPASQRLLEQPAGSMCNYKVKVTGTDEVDAELLDWVRQAYESAA